MKKLFLSLLLGLSFIANAQEDCQYTIVTTEENKEIKSTKEYLMHEKVFGNTSQFMFFSLSNNDGVPLLNFQMLAKSKEFPKSYCLDKTSKIYIQLLNGTIITLISALDEQCSSLIYDNTEKNNIRILTGTFLFTKGSLEELEKYPISFIRVKYVNESVDYPMKKELQSESMSKKYFPESYFMNFLKCIQ
ncbi:hypothetical protein [Flavobacterium cerinum]|uniref:Uncharacterized protein n=1 Tax=Flavobacterium cerinum TaxID=2502784 RepID=A0A3S3RKD9_9FLAO|nr:hypothetical protein [Flavobacterium cerinum]RWX01478.1 hypothetical protein EPI11_05845 [Flavobacterium cerinum]